MYINAFRASKVMVYVHNPNQERHYFCALSRQFFFINLRKHLRQQKIEISSLLSFQMVVPNEKTVYGSASTIVLTTGRYTTSDASYCYRNEKYSQVLYITRTHLKALDQPSQRCNQRNANITTSTCIARFLEKKLGCNPMILGSEFSQTPKCTNKTQLLALANASKQFAEADEDDIYEITGCLPSCEKDQYSLRVDPLKSELETRHKCQVHLEFIMLDSSYKEEEQYIIYDLNSFIADVGGYMGLLLGSSLLSLYKVLETIMRKVLCRPFKGNTGI